ncbi:MAG: hypothetical protein KDA28_08690 [Phycisphaerales bacterium]|nr:hypothetical protein [Phycisphaerales bacterium]
MNTRQRMLLETTVARDEAEAVLRVLIDAKDQSERHMAALNQHDAMKSVTGRSSMDNAINTTRRLIETYHRVLDEMRSGLTEEDLALIED